jgi:hypothetical protein
MPSIKLKAAIIAHPVIAIGANIKIPCRKY